MDALKGTLPENDALATLIDDWDATLEGPNADAWRNALADVATNKEVSSKISPHCINVVDLKR